MIREPYNINPYNSTIDTSEINQFGFTFSGDELGSWEVEIAKNNTSPEIIYKSDMYEPTDVGYDHIFDGDMVEGIFIPSIKATNEGNDGSIRKVYKFSSQLTENIGNAVKAVFDGITADVIHVSIDENTIHYIVVNEGFGTSFSTPSCKLYNLGEDLITTLSQETFTFAGYIITITAREELTSSINLTEDVIQFNGAIFDITKFDTTSNSSYYYIYCISNTDPIYLSTEDKVTYYIFKGKGKGDVTYSGKNITIGGIDEGEIKSIKLELEPYVDYNGYDGPWAAGEGENKFHLNSIASPNFESEQIWKIADTSWWGQRIFYKATMTIIRSLPDGISFEITNIQKKNSVYDSWADVETVTDINATFNFPFNSSQISMEPATFANGSTYYMKCFDENNRTISCPVGFIIGTDENYSQLENNNSILIQNENAHYIGFTYYVGTWDPNSNPSITISPVISQNSVPTQKTPYANIGSFGLFEKETFIRKCIQFERLDSSSIFPGGGIVIHPINPGTEITSVTQNLGESENSGESENIVSPIVKLELTLPNNSEIDFYGGEITITKSNDTVSAIGKAYKTINGYNSSYEEELQGKHWWSNKDLYAYGTFPSNGAYVIYNEVEESNDDENNSESSSESNSDINFDITITPQTTTFPIPLSTENTNIIYAEEELTYGGRVEVESEGDSTETEPEYTQSSNMELIVSQVPDKKTGMLRQMTGENLIWRTRLWEIGTPAEVRNFVKAGRFLQDAARIAEKTYEGEVSNVIFENIVPDEGIITVPVQIGDDLFIERKIPSGLICTIMPSILYTNLATDMQTFAGLLTTDCILEIDNYIFKIASVSLSEDSSYIRLTLQSLDGLINTLTQNSYYEYTIEFPADTDSSLINSYVDKYTYTLPTREPNSTTNIMEFGVKIASNPINKIVKAYYWLYSDGTPRAFYTLANSLEGIVRGQEYRLYNNFYNSNWYFFQSRKTPVLTLSAKNMNDETISLPILDYDSRTIVLEGTYYQADSTPIRYHSWQFDEKINNEIKTIYNSGEIYTSDLTLTYDLLEPEKTYTITLKVVNQDGVEVSISKDLGVSFEEENLAEYAAIVNNDLHFVELSWMNGLTTEADEDYSSGDFDTHIGVGESEQDVTVEDTLTYSTIAGAPIDLNGSDITIRMGFVVNDNAKVVNPKKEFYNSDLLTLVAENNPLVLKKEGLKFAGSASSFFLDDAEGQLTSEERSKANYFLGKNYIWDENDNKTWKDDYYWTETQSDTNCYYYELVIQDGKLRAWRTPFWNGKNFEYDFTNHKITIPYNPLLMGASQVGVRIFDGSPHSEDVIYSIATKSSTDPSKMTLTLGGPSYPAFTPKQIVVFGNTTSMVFGKNADQSDITEKEITIPSKIKKFIIGRHTYVFYFTVYNELSTTFTQPLPFGVKPNWTDQNTGDKIIINAKFNGSTVSSKLEGVDAAFDSYKIFRLKYKPTGGTKNNPTIDESAPIYRRLIGEFNLTEEGVTTTPKIKFIDWTVENRGIYIYEIIPVSSKSGTVNGKIVCPRQKLTEDGDLIPICTVTDWYGWSFTSFSKYSNRHYEPVERWLFKLNLETNGYTHQTNKAFNQGFNRYPKASIGVTNYITTNLSCLIGEIRKELQRIEYFRPNQGYTRDTIHDIEEWENFSNESNLVLIKDYKGRAFIGLIDGNTISFQDVVSEILTQLSFNITQVDDVANYQIFSIEGEN